MIDHVIKFALFPLLLAQAETVRAGVIPLPEPPGARAGRVGQGERELRLLVLGDSSAAGVGATRQDEALALPLARALARRQGCAVRWRLIAQTGLTSAATLACLQDEGAPTADIAVVVVGVNDITQQVPVAEALRCRGEIAVWLHAHCGVRDVLFPALPEMELFPALPQPLAWWAGQMSRRNNRAQARWAHGWPLAEPRVAHVPMDGAMHPEMMGADGFHPGPGLYARVVLRLADHIERVVLTGDEFTEENA